jgi:pyruvate/2-oxoglutarate dehydrogenase complex dihydrolipoamide acyltransferase (E2) component
VVKVAVTVERGNLVTINHDGYLTTDYGHLGEVLVTTGETVTAGTIIARAGQTLGRLKESGPGQPDAGEVVAVSKAREPALFFAIKGDTALFEEGTMSSSLDFGTRPLPIDPSTILATAPAPGELRTVVSSEEKMMSEARDGYAELAMTASTPSAQIDAFTAYDMATAVTRAQQIAAQSRSTYTSQEATQRPARTVRSDAALTLAEIRYTARSE